MIEKYFKIAATVACAKDDSRLFLLGCCAIRDDGVIVAASNGPAMVGIERDEIRRSFAPAHAEIRCAKKLDKNAIVFVSRIRKDNGKYAMAKPCKSCLNVLLSKKVKRIYYTIDENHYGIIKIKNGKVIDVIVKTI